jgi:transposase-like protein
MTRQDDHAETHTPTFKAKVAVAAVKGEKTLTELTQQLTCIRIQITSWKAQLLDGAAGGIRDRGLVAGRGSDHRRKDAACEAVS